MPVVGRPELIDRLAALLDFLPVPAALATDPVASEVRINARFAQLIGVSPEAYVALTDPSAPAAPYAILRDGIALTGEAAPFARALRGEPVDAERLDLISVDGSRHPLVVTCRTLIDEGEVVGAIAILHDIESEVVSGELVRELARSTPALLFTATPDGAVDFVTPRWSDLIGVPVRELLDRGWSEYIHPDDREAVFAAWARSVETGEALFVEWRIRRPDGTYRWVRIRAEARRDASGAVARWYGAGTDIDAERRAIDALEFLARTGVTVAAASDVPTVLERLAHAALEGIADVAFFDVRQPDGAFRRFVTTAEGIPDAVAFAVASYPAPALDDPHPIARSMVERRTILIPHVDDDFLAANVRPADRRQKWRDAGIRSLIVAPLVVAGRTFGALTLLRTRQDVPFESSDGRVLEEIGRRAAIALENVRLNALTRDAALRGEREFRAIADAMPQIMYVSSADGSLEWANGRWYEFTGRLPVETLGDDWTGVVHPEDRPEMEAAWTASLAAGTPFQAEFRLRRADGSYRWFLGRSVPVRDVAGAVSRWYGTSTDIDDARRSRRALQTFADVGEAVTASLGLQKTLDRVMQFVVPEYADWAFITLADEAGDLRLATVYHDDEAKRAVLTTQIGQIYAFADATGGSRHALRTGEPVLYRNAGYEDALRVANPGVIDVFWEVGFHSVLVIPLMVGTTARGTLVLLMAESDRALREPDVPFFQEIARRVAPAIANAEIFERERRVAQTFQEAALPATLPVCDGYAFSAIYEAGRAEALVGGDWYDAFRLIDGRIVVSIGDVAGSGLQSAVTMASVRQAIRGVAQVHADPELMLEAADRSLRAEKPDHFVTAFVGVIDPIAGSVTYRSAGHPPPFLRRPDGTVEALLGVATPPLGLRERDDSDAPVVELEPGALLVLYTDGLTESTRDVQEGERRVREAVANVSATSDHPAKAIHDAVLIEGSHDDVAILTVAVGKRRAAPAWEFDVRDAAAARAARDALVATLAAAGYRESLRAPAELIFAELVGNLARHAPGRARVVLESEDNRHVVHVLDRGPGFTFVPRLPQDVLSESGRGLFLVAALADDFQVARRPGGGSHARVVLRHL